MDYKLQKLMIDDGVDIYGMLQEMLKDENGFINSINGRTFAL